MGHTGNLKIMLDQSANKQMKIYYVTLFKDEQHKFWIMNASNKLLTGRNCSEK